MIQSNVFNYINVLDKAADASWQRNELISNNIANNTTPDYKRKDIDFEAQLKRALRNSHFTSVDSRVDGIRQGSLDARVYTDSANFAYRVDGNNVDPELEAARLAENQIKYNGLIDSINQEFSNLKLAMRK
jgi:flagellar basal-body rod protein FlgB